MIPRRCRTQADRAEGRSGGRCRGHRTLPTWTLPAPGLAEDDWAWWVPPWVDGIAGARTSRLAVELRRCHAPTHTLRVLHDDLVPCGAIAEVDLVARPRGSAGSIEDVGSAQTESRCSHSTRLVHRARRPGVPGPAAATDVRGGFRGPCRPAMTYGSTSVAMDPGPGAGVVDRVQDGGTARPPCHRRRASRRRGPTRWPRGCTGRRSRGCRAGYPLDVTRDRRPNGRMAG